MKSVLISIQPKWCELIASSKKTIEVRKTRPKLETPFKCYIYCTKSKEIMFNVFLNEPEKEVEYLSGKVIGEFVCDKIEEWNTTWLYGDDELQKETCLDDTEIMDYMNNYTDRIFYLWHISDLIIYDKPKDLNEFSRYGAHIRGGCCIKDNCKHYISNGYFEPPECSKEGCTITRPFQSWGYVEQ